MKKLITILILATLALQSSAQWNVVGVAFAGTIRGIYFTDENTGYAVGGDATAVAYVAKTTDGGITWSSGTVTGSNLMRSVQFIDENNGYACGQGGVVYKTTDAGNTWSNVYTDASQYFRAINFVSSTTGFMAGAAGTIWKTTDGGTSWSSYSTGVVSDMIQIHMADANTGYACASTGTSPFSNGYVFKTTDGGTSWSQVYNDPATGLLGLAVYDANTVYVGGVNQTIIKTDDGGATWSSVFAAGFTGPSIRTGVVVTNETIYMADDNGYVQGSVKAGSNWTNVFYATGGIYCMNFPSKTIGYSGDLNGNVWKYDASATCSVDVPIGLSTAVFGPTKVQVFWTNSYGASKYKIRYQSQNGTWTVNNNYNARFLKDLTPGTKYSWQVKAFCGQPYAGSSDWSEKAAFKTPPLKIGVSEEEMQLAIYPNPVSSTATISFSLNQESKVTVDLFTIDGKKVMSFADQQFPSGANEITMNRGSLSSGVYILQLKTDEGLFTRKLSLE